MSQRYTKISLPWRISEVNSEVDSQTEVMYFQPRIILRRDIKLIWSFESIVVKIIHNTHYLLNNPRENVFPRNVEKIVGFCCTVAVFRQVRYKCIYSGSYLCFMGVTCTFFFKIAFRNNPAGKWRLYNVASTSMQRHDVASTLIRRYLNVACPLGRKEISRH